MATKAFLDFVCGVCDENLRDPEKRAGFTTSLRETPERIAQMLQESLNGGDMPIRAKTLRVIGKRTDVSSKDIPQIMARLSAHFLQGAKHPYDTFAFEI
ncbi:MAG TPA: hypothetical protein VJH94_02775 [Candidatus Paceibacterota bacterium]